MFEGWSQCRPKQTVIKPNIMLFLLKIIFETTILQRDFVSRGECYDDYLFRIIHVASTAGILEKGLEEFVEILRSYAGNDLQKKIIEFLRARAGITKHLTSAIK
jgi:hypothetical protein